MFLLQKAAEEAKATTHAQLAQLLTSSPAVIYSFKATGDFAPTFVSENIRDRLDSVRRNARMRRRVSRQTGAMAIERLEQLGQRYGNIRHRNE
jgi:hypothetical protein